MAETIVFTPAPAPEPKLKTFEVQARHVVEITYRVQAPDERAAVEALFDIGLFTNYGDTFGPCEYVMDAHGIEMVDSDCYSDPSPTREVPTTRDHWEVECDEEEDEA